MECAGFSKTSTPRRTLKLTATPSNTEQKTGVTASQKKPGLGSPYILQVIIG
jgi:hypothetical protein